MSELQIKKGYNESKKNILQYLFSNQTSKQMQGQAGGASNLLSQINIRFGQISQHSPSPINLTFSIEYCSSKIQNKRFNAAQYLNTQIPLNSLLIELQAKQDGEQLATKLNQIRKNSASMQKLQQENQVIFNIIGKGNKVYLFLRADRFQQIIQQLNKKLNTQNLIQKDQKWLEIKVKSINRFDKINQLITKTGVVGSFLDSLFVNIRFNKTQNVKQLIKKFFNNSLGQAVSDTLVSSFQYLNLDLQFESAANLQNFPIFKQHLKIFNMNHDFSSIRSLLGNKLEIFAFGKPFGLYLNLTAEDLYFALDLLFA